MAQASKTVKMPVSADTLWALITDYEKYGEFVSTIKSVEVLSSEAGQKKVKYNIELLGKDIHYTIVHNETPKTEMTWTIVDSNIMKVNNGGWKLNSLGPNEVEVTYTLDLEFKIYVPGLVLSGLVKSTLPSMLGEFEKRALKGV